MPLTFASADDFDWQVRKIAVFGPGIVGTPMAALLAAARVTLGTDEPAKVLVVQRPSATSGWKVDAINRGRSPIGGIEPDLDRIVAEGVAAGLLGATHDAGHVADADVILVCVQTDKDGLRPDYGPLMAALDAVAAALQQRPPGNRPLVIIESTLAPSSMSTLIRERFSRHGLEEGRDVLLGNSPNRVMPGRLVERVTTSDKVIGGLHPLTPKLIGRLYSHIVPAGTLHETNSLTAEIVKTVENAFRDVRIAFSTEVARYCDDRDLDFYRVRDLVNRRLGRSDQATSDPNTVPSGALLVPSVGVGGHCLPKDGILLWWRALEAGLDASASLVLAARSINDGSPAEAIRLAERTFGSLAGDAVAVMGAAYRFNSEDTRNSPGLVLARLLIDRGCRVAIHDPFVRADDQNLSSLGLVDCFTPLADRALAGARVAFFCTSHQVYAERGAELLAAAPDLGGIFDGCNLFRRDQLGDLPVPYTGIGRGRKPAPPGLLESVEAAFEAVERGLANELERLVGFLNDRYTADSFNRVDIDQVRRIAGTCVTGCRIVAPGPVPAPPRGEFSSHLAALAATA